MDKAFGIAEDQLPERSGAKILRGPICVYIRKGLWGGMRGFSDMYLFLLWIYIPSLIPLLSSSPDRGQKSSHLLQYEGVTEMRNSFANGAPIRTFPICLP
jgi:hypothetical protein